MYVETQNTFINQKEFKKFKAKNWQNMNLIIHHSFCVQKSWYLKYSSVSNKGPAYLIRLFILMKFKKSVEFLGKYPTETLSLKMRQLLET